MPKSVGQKKSTSHSQNLKVIITTDGEKGFFTRGKKIAKLVDKRKSIPRRHIINFDDAEEMLTIFTKARRSLMAFLRERDASITDIVQLTHRNRAAVTRDIKLLERYGLVTVSEEINPGHGHRKVVHAISKQPIHLETTI